MSSDQALNQATKAVKELIETFLNKINTYEKGRQARLSPYLSDEFFEKLKAHDKPNDLYTGLLADARTLALAHAIASAIKDSNKLIEFASAINKTVNEINQAKLITQSMLTDMANQIISFLENISISQLHDDSRQHLSKLISSIIQSPDNQHNGSIKRILIKKAMADQLKRLEKIHSKITSEKEICNISALASEIENLIKKVADIPTSNQKSVPHLTYLRCNSKKRQQFISTLQKNINNIHKELTRTIHETCADLIEDGDTYDKSCFRNRSQPPSRKHTDDTPEDIIQALREKASTGWSLCGFFNNSAKSALIQALNQHQQNIETLKKDTVESITNVFHQGILHLRKHHYGQSADQLKKLLEAFQSTAGSLPDHSQPNASHPHPS